MKGEHLNTGMIPEGMSTERYRSLFKKMNTPEAIGNEEIKRIEAQWKAYSEKKTYGAKTGKIVTTQDLSRESIKKSTTDTTTIKKSTPPSTTIKSIEKVSSDTIAGVTPTKLQSKVIKTAPKIMKGAALFIGTTSLLSAAGKAKDKHETKAQVKQIEKRTKEQMKKEAEKKDKYQKKKSYNNIDAGQIVMDMFNQRIGHHKMGNSRF